MSGGKISALIPDSDIEAAAKAGELAQLSGIRFGRSTGVALSLIAKAMMNPEEPTLVFHLTAAEKQVLLSQVESILSELNYKCFGIEVTNRGFIITYNPWRPETVAELTKKLGVDNG